MNEIERLFSPRTRHYPDLEGAIMQALGREDYHLAFGLADRRCRLLPRPNARVHLLRAEALHRLSLTAEAVEDVAAARELEPDDVLAARRMFAWDDGDGQLEAAIAIARFDADVDLLRSALVLLESRGKQDFSRINVQENEVSGWVAWPRGTDLRIVLATSDLVQSIGVTEQQNHRLSSPTRCVADFRLARPASEEIQSFRILRDDIVVLDDPLPPNRNAPALSSDYSNSGEELIGETQTLTVIVPIYGDVIATEACLASLHIAMLRTPNCRAVLVDDASPDEKIKSLVAQYAGHQLFQLVTNERNLGFVGAVNRGLGMITSGDILLLNADTLLPADALNGLRTAVTKNAGIGTATPLSNNGEFTSFPVAYRINAMPGPEDVTVINSAAAKVNADTVVDIPNGIGFCLYVTRACLDAVERLSLDFHRGYLEDVDFCLRASEAGLRNVCVPSVYVGHVGSRSFRQDKRSLVVRNLRILQARYPRYEAECAAFMLADPLRSSRSALERSLLAVLARDSPTLVLSGNGATREIAFGRARRLVAKKQRTWIVTFQAVSRGDRATVTSADGRAPQSLEFDLCDQDHMDTFLHLLTKCSERGLEILGPEALPSKVINFIQMQGLAYKLVLADTKLAAHPERKWGVRPKWQTLVSNAQSIVALDQRSAGFAEAVLGIPPRLSLQRQAGGRIKPQSKRQVLGVVATKADVQEFEFLRTLALAVAGKPAFRIVVLGQTLDDVKLMQLPGVLVTGKVSGHDVKTLIQGHGICKIVLDAGVPVFGHPVQIACEATKLPCAFFHWTGETRKVDLPLAPGASKQTLVDLINQWGRLECLASTRQLLRSGNPVFPRFEGSRWPSQS